MEDLIYDRRALPALESQRKVNRWWGQLAEARDRVEQALDSPPFAGAVGYEEDGIRVYRVPGPDDR